MPELRDVSVTIRLTHREATQVNAAAAIEDVRVSDFIRGRVLPAAASTLSRAAAEPEEKWAS